MSAADDDERRLVPFLEALGAVTATSGTLGYLLGEVYATLIGSRMGAVVASGQNFDTVLQACRAILDHTEHELNDDLRAALDRAKSLYEVRNEAVHGVWLDYELDDDSHERTSFRPRRWRPRVEPRRWTVEELRRLARDMEESSERIFELMKRYVGEADDWLPN